MEKVEKGEPRMNSQMSKGIRNWLLIAVLIVVALLATSWATYTISQMPFPRRGPAAPEGIAGDLEFFYVARTVISTVNIALLLILLFTYVDVFRKTRSEFSVGLLIFSVAFLFKDVAGSSFVSGAFGFRSYGLGPFELLPDLFEFVALAVLLYLSVEY